MSIAASAEVAAAGYVSRLIKLDNPVRDYAWGSTTAIPALLGTEASGQPVAELWIGAHPDSPSRSLARSDRPGLDALIAADPAGLLGPDVASRFGARLPFLVKLLAADRALSIQVHPNQAQAEAGYAAENAAGLAQDSPLRNYRDGHHKPEMAYAITEFDAFCGFRPVPGTVELLDALDVAPLRAYRDLLVGAGGPQAAFSALLAVTGTERDQLIEQTLAGCRRLVGAGRRWTDVAAACLLAGADHPGDIGAVLLLLLNLVRLAPGEAIYLGAGNVHAYLRGVCLELLATSDNVLRAGLTGKHLDVPELVRIADFSPTVQPRLQPAEVTGGRVSFRPPVPDFELAVCRQPTELPGRRPYLVLAGEAPVRLGEPAGNQAELAPWQAAFVAAGAGSCLAEPSGRLFVASVGAAR
ncbi:MAG: mannose-6-phosphate isomerase, class I [Jatrophihabitantaceae bacterium]